MNVTVFGGSQPGPGSPAYQEAYELGALLAAAGHAVLNGGYIGTMEAVSRGAREAGGRVIGVTCVTIEAWRPVRPNPWLSEERRCATLQERLQQLVAGCEAAIALPGGPGTLAEIALMWNQMIIGELPRRPLVLVGGGWQSVFDQAFTRLEAYYPEHQKALLRFVPDAAAAARALGSPQAAPHLS